VIPCELLILAKGVHPNTELIQDTDIRKRQGIETDPYMQTSHENIFAAGDVAEAFDITTEEHAINALWTCAVQQGRIAGLNIIGEQEAYDGAVGMNSLDICNSPLISYGITSPKDGSRYQMLVYEQPANNVYKKIVLKDHRIKGIILLGRIDNAVFCCRSFNGRQMSQRLNTSCSTTGSTSRSWLGTVTRPFLNSIASGKRRLLEREVQWLEQALMNPSTTCLRAQCSETLTRCGRVQSNRLRDAVSGSWGCAAATATWDRAASIRSGKARTQEYAERRRKSSLQGISEE